MSLTQNLKNLGEKLTGKAKEAAGEAIDNENLRKEGEAQQEKAEAKADAERLEELAEEKKDEANGYAGQEKAQAQDR